MHSYHVHEVIDTKSVTNISANNENKESRLIILVSYKIENALHIVYKKHHLLKLWLKGRRFARSRAFGCREGVKGINNASDKEAHVYFTGRQEKWLEQSLLTVGCVNGRVKPDAPHSHSL
jgi:hypothetical protein